MRLLVKAGNKRAGRHFSGRGQHIAEVSKYGKAVPHCGRSGGSAKYFLA
jgi:hypothetical protein